jgi:hypothetical protein
MTRPPIEDVSWPAIVDQLFQLIEFRERMVLKRKARGRHRRRRARRGLL